MSEAHPVSSLFVISLFFASSATMSDTTPMLETATPKDLCYWNRNDTIRDQTNQSCYLFVSELMTFHQANESCVEEGAHLVSIGNQSENALVSGLIQSDVWIGLYRLTNESCAGRSCTTWMWLDGSGLEYDAWVNPNVASTTQCVYMNTYGMWEHGRHCSRDQSFVCEKSIPPSTTPEPTTMAVTSEMTDTSLPNSARTGVTDKKNTNDRPGNDNRPIIIGCVVGGLALVVIVTVVAVVLLKRHRRSPSTDQPMEDKEEETPPVAKHVRYNPGYEDMDLGETQGATNVTFKPSTGNTDTGAHSGGDNQLYSEPMKETDRPGSKDILVNENTLYGSGK